MKFLQFDSLQNIPGLRYAITTRGGSCAGPYDDLNLAYHVGDDAERVTQNRKKLAAELGYDATRLVAAQQVHGNNSYVVTEAGRGAFDWDSALPDCDALIVQEPNIPVLIQVADCAPILLVDPKNHVLAVVHAGWRGAVARITSRTIKRMQSQFGTHSKNLKIGIGPCLAPESFDVGPEVIESVRDAGFLATGGGSWERCMGVGGPEALYLNLDYLLQQDLGTVGVQAQQIEKLDHCPRLQIPLFFSHRGQNGTAGRFGLVAWWEE